MDDQKPCATCKVVQPLNAFYPRNDRGRYESRCKKCCAKRCREYQQRFKRTGPTVVLAEKQCWRCKTTKPVEAFGRSVVSRDGLNQACKVCAAEYSRRVSNPRRLARDPTQRISQIWRNYRLRPDEYLRLLNEQGNCCRMCRRPFVKTPCVDHCHTTGRVRGLLCSTCNSGLGIIEREGFLEMALKYLETADTGG